MGPIDRLVGSLAASAVRMTSNPRTFLIALAIVLAWALTGPLFAYSNTWQLVINTGTTIVTFLLGFLTQHALSLAGAAHRDRIEDKVDDLHARFDRHGVPR